MVQPDSYTVVCVRGLAQPDGTTPQMRLVGTTTLRVEP
jgi:hypothetical protein